MGAHGGSWEITPALPCAQLLPIPGLRMRRGIPEAGEKEAVCPEGPPSLWFPRMRESPRRSGDTCCPQFPTQPYLRHRSAGSLGRAEKGTLGPGGSPSLPPRSPSMWPWVPWGGSREGRAPGSAAAVPTPGRVASHGALELREGKRAQGDGAGAHGAEAEPLVEGHQSVLAHERGPAHRRLAAQVLQVAPHQCGALALAPASLVHGQHVQVGSVAPRPVQRQRLLGMSRDVSPAPSLPILGSPATPAGPGASGSRVPPNGAPSHLWRAPSGYPTLRPLEDPS